MPIHLLDDLSPHARVATAVLPFVLAIVLRILLGRGRFTSLAITVTTVWFTVNVLMAPYSARMRQDIQDLESIFR